MNVCIRKAVHAAENYFNYKVDSTVHERRGARRNKKVHICTMYKLGQASISTIKLNLIIMKSDLTRKYLRYSQYSLQPYVRYALISVRNILDLLCYIQ